MSRYEMSLDDKVSGPARAAASAVRGLRAGLTGLHDSLTKVGRGATYVGRGMNGQFTASRMVGTLGAAKRGLNEIHSATGITFGDIIRGAAQATSAIVRMGFAFGRNTVEMLSFRESSLAAMEAVTGSSDEAGRSFRNSMTMANQTPLDTRDVVGAQTRFAVAGFSERERTPLIGAMSDLQSALGTTAGNSFSLVVSQMRAADNMDRGDLRQLLNAGVNTGAVLDSIARQLNVRGNDPRAVRARVLRMLSQRQVRGDVGIQAALDAINERYDRGAGLGSYARRQSETLTGALSNARNAWDNLIGSMDTRSIPGLQTMREAVLAITRALGPDAPAGAALGGIVRDLFNVVGQGLFGGLNDASMRGFADTLQEMRPAIRDVAGGVVALLKGFGSGFWSAVAPMFDTFNTFTDGGTGTGTADSLRKIGEAAGFLLGAMVWGAGLLGGLIYSTVLRPIEYLSDAAHWLADVPGQMVDGFIAGMQREWQRLTAELGILAADLPEPVKRALGIRSPSRVFMELGMHTARGFELGLERGGEGVGRAMDAFVTVPQAPVAESFGARPAITLQVQVTVQSREGDDPEQTGRGIGRGLAAELADLLALLNAGMAPAAAAS